MTDRSSSGTEEAHSVTRADIHLGSMLDEWDRLSNDERGEVRSLCPAFVGRLERLKAAVDRFAPDELDPPAKWLDEALRNLARELLADPKTPWIGERDPKQHICWTAADRLRGVAQPDDTTKTVYVKRWRTLVKLPAKYADEIVEALRGVAQAPLALEALTLAEDVLSRTPFSTGIWPNGMHPQRGIEKIREAIRALSVSSTMRCGPDLSTVAKRNAFYSSEEYRNMTTAEKCAVQGDGFTNDYD